MRNVYPVLLLNKFRLWLCHDLGSRLASYLITLEIKAAKARPKENEKQCCDHKIRTGGFCSCTAFVIVPVTYQSLTRRSLLIRHQDAEYLYVRRREFLRRLYLSDVDKRVAFW